MVVCIYDETKGIFFNSMITIYHMGNYVFLFLLVIN